MKEEWDLYTREGLPLGEKALRGDALPFGAFHLVVMALIVNDRKELLMTRRSAEKLAWPGLWECTAGSVLAGESSGEEIGRAHV